MNKEDINCVYISEDKKCMHPNSKKIRKYLFFKESMICILAREQPVIECAARKEKETELASV